MRALSGICLYGVSYFDLCRQKEVAALGQSELRRQQMRGTLLWVFPQMLPSDWELSWDGYLERP